MSLEPCKVDPRVRRTQQMLFRACQELLSEKTFDLITVQDIAERSTLNRATFYDHFPDKFALLEAMMRESINGAISCRIRQKGEGTCGAALRQLILAAYDVLANVSDCQKQQRHFAPLVESQLKAALGETLLEALRSHGAKCPEMKAAMISWAIAGAALQWTQEGKGSADQFAQAVFPTIHAALIHD